MALATELIKKFVEEDFKDFSILVICDNEHRFYHRTHNCPDIIWDWDNEAFMAMDVNENVADQQKHPIEVVYVSFGEIQFLHAFADTEKTLELINEKYTDEKSIKKAKSILQKIRPSMMGARTLRDGYTWPASQPVEIQKVNKE